MRTKNPAWSNTPKEISRTLAVGVGVNRVERPYFDAKYEVFFFFAGFRFSLLIDRCPSVSTAMVTSSITNFFVQQTKPQPLLFEVIRRLTTD